MLLPRLSSSLARDGEAECSTPDSGGSVGAARAAVLSPSRLRSCPRRARGLCAPGCFSRPAREPGKGPAGGRGGRGCGGRPAALASPDISGPRPSRGRGPGGRPACRSHTGSSVPELGPARAAAAGASFPGSHGLGARPQLRLGHERLGKFGPVPRRSWHQKKQGAARSVSGILSPGRAARAWGAPGPKLPPPNAGLPATEPATPGG